ncbi:MAG: transcriptional repressor LexA [Acidimicrobiia bacterium]|nr:transcriptional repressor LexA [Acidimicrobiia bacterium]
MEVAELECVDGHGRSLLAGYDSEGAHGERTSGVRTFGGRHLTTNERSPSRVGRTGVCPRTRTGLRCKQTFDLEMRGDGMEGTAGKVPTQRQRDILDCIEQHVAERGYPPSVREIGEAVGLGSPSTVHAHLETLERLGYLRRDPTKPRAIEVLPDPSLGEVERRPSRLVPMVGDVAAGVNVLANERIEELVPLPADFTGDGELFMLKVRGDSMIEAAIIDGDYVVARTQPVAANGDIVVAGIPGDEATVKVFTRQDGLVRLLPANAALEPLEYPADEVAVYGKVVTVIRRVE